jgi:hypothetical protein
MIAGQVRDPLVIQWLYDQTREVPGDAGKPRLQ